MARTKQSARKSTGGRAPRKVQQLRQQKKEAAAKKKSEEAAKKNSEKRITPKSQTAPGQTHTSTEPKEHKGRKPHRYRAGNDMYHKTIICILVLASVFMYVCKCGILC